MASSPLSTYSQTIGPLQCTIVDTPGKKDSPRAVVVLCHGFGAPGDDLVPCAAELYRSNDPPLDGVKFVFPAAPIKLEPGGLYDSRAWWPIDMLQLQEMMASGEFRDLRNQQPELLEERYEQLVDVVQILLDETGLTNEQLVLGGFSQGSMLATETALRMESAPAGLIVWSGTLLCESRWRELAAKRGKLSIVQTHGQIDPVLPLMGSRWLHDLFIEFGLDARFFPFMGMHTISQEGLSKGAELISRCL